MSRFQNWLFKLVNSSGPVSPTIRATERRIPVRIPGQQARIVMRNTERYLGIPKATADSRM